MAALKLRRGGWRVPVLDTPVGPRSDGGYVIAVVYHPRSCEQFSELRYRNAD